MIINFSIQIYVAHIIELNHAWTTIDVDPPDNKSVIIHVKDNENCKEELPDNYHCNL